jgi:electron transport complex protein RnfB
MTVEGGAGTGWAAWSHEQAAAARERHDFRIFRLQRDKIESDALLAAKTGEALDSVKPKPAIDGKTAEERKKSIIQAALRQARLKRESLAKRAAAGGTAPVTTETE